MVRSEDELAAVLAHESAHVVARHAAERITQMGALEAARMLAYWQATAGGAWQRPGAACVGEFRLCGQLVQPESCLPVRAVHLAARLAAASLWLQCVWPAHPGGAAVSHLLPPELAVSAGSPIHSVPECVPLRCACHVRRLLPCLRARRAARPPSWPPLLSRHLPVLRRGCPVHAAPTQACMPLPRAPLTLPRPLSCRKAETEADVIGIQIMAR